MCTRMHIHIGQKQFTCLSMGNWKFFSRHIQGNIFELFVSSASTHLSYFFQSSMCMMYDHNARVQSKRKNNDEKCYMLMNLVIR